MMDPKFLKKCLWRNKEEHVKQNNKVEEKYPCPEKTFQYMLYVFLYNKYYISKSCI